MSYQSFKKLLFFNPKIDPIVAGQRTHGFKNAGARECFTRYLFCAVTTGETISALANNKGGGSSHERPTEPCFTLF